MTTIAGKKTLSVSHRLMTLGITAFVGMGTILGVGWYQQQQVEDGLQDAAAIWKQSNELNDLKSASLEMILAAMDTIVDRHDGKVTPERLALMAETSQKLKSGAATVSSLAKIVAHPELASGFEAKVETASRAIQTDLRRLVETRGSDEEFDAIDDAIDGAGDAIGKVLEQLSAFGTDLANQQIAEMQALSRQALWIQLICGAIAMAIVGLLQVIHGGAIQRGVRNVKDSMARIVAGDCQTPVPGTDGMDELGEMARATEVFRQAALEKIRLEQQTAEERQRIAAENAVREAEERADTEAVRTATQALASALTRLSEGDLNVTIERPFRADLEPVRADFNRLTAKLRLIMAEIAGSSSSIQANAQQMRSAADDLAKRTEQQAASLEQTSAALEQITRTVRTATERAEGASHLVSQAKDFAESSSHVVTDAMAAMERIEDATGEIGKIINVVEEIAFQTNLLALNAGVEAARAGEAGKGFAVVAQEVRELAGRAAGAAKDIKSLVTRSSAEVQTGVELVKATGDALHRIGDDVLKINDDVGAIVTSAREQFIGLSEINSAIGQMDQTTQQNAAMVEETNASSHTLASDADTLTRLMAQFSMDTSARPRAVDASGTPAQARPSPARSLMNKVASAISSSSPAARSLATATKEKWEEF
ncbi:methyl-accepting chemotaxis protein [Rhizobium straminoryzae]|uniref:Methyl-accepting chemotaxis protein n=1 Tax=Rhizobium straminoryzae TaxID=1387186 RepID=A0A549T6H3_9HYPH|nr:methyl-accepting chemotaxis protein [Rhizobium straminoryzae]TRL37477.1 methyl-accepting chemotaxis protein [Rhizobium straminoryzae]